MLRRNAVTRPHNDMTQITLARRGRPFNFPTGVFSRLVLIDRPSARVLPWLAAARVTATVSRAEPSVFSVGAWPMKALPITRIPKGNFMKNYRVRTASAGSIALLALLLSACGDAQDPTQEPDTAADEGVEEEEPQADEASEADETHEDAAAEEGEGEAEGGGRDNPLPLGETIETGDWSVTINSFTANADDEVAGENEFNDPAPEGHSYALINADATYNGDDSEMVMMGVSIDYVTSSGETVGAFDSMAVAPDALESSAELFEGGTESGNIALAIPEDDDGLIRVQLGMLEQEDAFFATQ